MRTISRPDFARKTWIASGATTALVNRDVSPILSRTRVAFGDSWMPAPVSCKPLRLIKQCDAEAPLAERKRSRQSADSGAGNDDGA